MKNYLRLQNLENRLAPAIATWDGGGANHFWSTAANWVGDVAPQSGDDLVFPTGPTQLTSVNDLAGLTTIGHVSINAYGYQITGGNISLVNGISSVPPSGTPGTLSNFAVGLVLNNEQTFTGGTYAVSSDINLNFFGRLTIRDFGLTLSGSIVGAGGITVDSNSSAYFTGNNNYLGATIVQRGTAFFNGTQNGSSTIALNGATVSGVGTIAILSASDGGVLKPGDGVPTILPTGHRLTAGELTLNGAGAGVAGQAAVLDVLVRTFTSDATDAHDQFVVNGPVVLRGKLKISTISFSHGGPLGDGTIKIIDNDGADPIGGIFAELPEGAVINGVNEKAVRISYKGGDGNDVTLTTVDPATVPRFAVAAGPGGGPQVNVYALGDSTNASVTGAPVFLRAFNAYDVSFRGGVHVATADLTGDGVIDIVTAPGNGGGPVVRIWNGATGTLVSEFNAYDPAFRGGAFVALSDFNFDRIPDIITGAGPGGGPHVKVFSGADQSLLLSFFPYATSFTGGVYVAGGDFYNDGRSLLVTGAGPGGGPHVEVFEPGFGIILLSSFYADNPTLRGGVTVAVGDVNNDGELDVITGAGAGTAPQVRVFSGFSSSPLLDYLAYSPLFNGGITVAAFDFYNLGANIITGPGPGGGPHVRSVDPNAINFMAFDPAFLGGIFVG